MIAFFLEAKDLKVEPSSYGVFGGGLCKGRRGQVDRHDSICMDEELALAPVPEMAENNA